MIVSKREKTILITTGILIFLAAVNFLVIEPLEESLSDLDKQEQGFLRRKTKIMGYLKREGRFRLKIEEIEKEIPRSSPEEMSNEFQVTLREMAEKAKLQVTQIQYLDQVSVLDKYKKMVFALRFECDIRQLKDYLYYIETSMSLLKVTQLNIIQRTKGAEKLTVNMRLATLVLALGDES